MILKLFISLFFVGAALLGLVQSYRLTVA